MRDLLLVIRVNYNNCLKSSFVKHISFNIFPVKTTLLSSILNLKNAKNLKKDKQRIKASSVASQ